MSSNKFVFVCPMRNASSTLAQMLFSVCGQSYDNWRIIIIDDASDNEHKEECRHIIDEFRGMNKGKYASRIDVVWNAERVWETANVVSGISMCEPEDIICRIDGDDYLCELDALRIMNDVYNVHKPDCLWTAHRWFDDKRVTSINISGELPADADPYKHPWVSSHLKTFRKSLIDGINDANFRDDDGNYFVLGGDQVIYLPVLKVAKRRLFLPMVMYAYRCSLEPETFQTEYAKEQRDVVVRFRARGFIE